MNGELKQVGVKLYPYEIELAREIIGTNTAAAALAVIVRNRLRYEHDRLEREERVLRKHPDE